MNDFSMERTSITITMACNLKCALCSTYSPYYNKATVFSLERLKGTLERYFKIVSHVKKFTVSGGEPFTHPYLPEFIDECNKYCTQIQTLEILTNGTVSASNKLLTSVKNYGGDIYFLIDNYGDNLSVKAKDIAETMKKNNIRYVLRDNYSSNAHCNGWVDFGDLTKKKLNTQEEVEALYAKCAHPQKFKFCFGTVDGIMYPCNPLRKCKEIGSISDNYDEYIDLFDDTLSVQQQREKIKAIRNRKSLSACAYCNGLCDDSERFTPAEQLTKQEVRHVRNGAKIYADVCRRTQK